MNSLNQYDDFRTYLIHLYEDKKEQNRRFSLRAFSHKLQVDPSSLSKILNGKRDISYKMFCRFSEVLNLPLDVRTHFQKNCYDIDPDKTIETYKNVDLDTFKIISEWYHYAILELTYLNNFRPEVEWVADKLGITRAIAGSAVERLFKAGLLDKDENGVWYDTQKSLTTTGYRFTSDAFKSLQRGVLEKAIIALENVPLAKRSQSSMTVAMDSSKLSVVQKKINKFRRDLTKYIESNDETGKDSVYNLSVSFYPVTEDMN